MRSSEEAFWDKLSTIQPVLTTATVDEEVKL